MTFFLWKLLLTRFFQIWEQPVCLSGHTDISDYGTYNRNNKKQDKVSCQKQYHHLKDILQYKKTIMIHHRNIIHLMGIYQCFFINQ